MQFLTLFLFFANNSRMEGPIPVFLTYLDLPNGLEGGSTANYFFWIFMLNKVCTAKREAILKLYSNEYFNAIYFVFLVVHIYYYR